MSCAAVMVRSGGAAGGKAAERWVSSMAWLVGESKGGSVIGDEWKLSLEKKE